MKMHYIEASLWISELLSQWLISATQLTMNQEFGLRRWLTILLIYKGLVLHVPIRHTGLRNGFPGMSLIIFSKSWTHNRFLIVLNLHNQSLSPTNCASKVSVTPPSPFLPAVMLTPCRPQQIYLLTADFLISCL